MQVRREQFGERGGDGLERRLVAHEVHISLHRETRRRQNAFGGFHIGVVEPEALGQLQPALDAAFAADVAVMILDPVPPFQPGGAVAETRDHHRVLDRDRALVIIAVQRPGLHLSLVQLAAMQQAMERMQVVITRRADMAQRCLQFLGALQRRALGRAKRRSFRVITLRHVQSVISVPSAAICQPARSAVLRSAESCSSAGLELLICRKIFLSISRSAKARDRAVVARHRNMSHGLPGLGAKARRDQFVIAPHRAIEEDQRCARKPGFQFVA